MTADMVGSPRIAALMLREAWRRARRRLRVGPVSHLRFAGAAPDRLLVVPPELRRGDPIIAEQIYGGRLHFAGQLVESAGRSPFQIVPPSQAWAAELHGFAWLRHLAEAGDALAAFNARSLVGDWIRSSGQSLGGTAFEVDVVARRLIAWLTHADLMLNGADHAFHRQFMKSLAEQSRYLRSVCGEAPDGLPRLRARIALAFASLCLPNGSGRIRTAAQNLGHELDRQIFADGGHLSRAPSAIPELLADLLPLRQTYVNQGQAVPKGIYSAIDRMLPALRFFRHSDGSIALFNGAGVTDLALVTALLRFDETLGETIGNARQSGYQRLSASRSVVIADTGTPPPPPLSSEAHAGALAFEFSSGGQRLVVNCGAPGRPDPHWRRLSRATAAHSTLTLADHSSARFSRSEAIDRFLGAPLIGGPVELAVSRDEPDSLGATGFTAVHDGYRQGFGLLHERRLSLAGDGLTLSGSDRLYTPAGKPPRSLREPHPQAVIRFHLHPAVQAEDDGATIRLQVRGQTWSFYADAGVTIEESVLFADSAGPRRTLQLVIAFDPAERDAVAWQFRRIG
ncbi:heparinase II/III family protein [Mangrovicella endophytica]|uniref:heparinase II/III family protein n=1 Tax=Mangrovicella endophytica TaxID=2066697 RepID=UPI000C9E96B5|nr:heparinase II/III family protein [Mangrovicella endophytica]